MKYIDTHCHLDMQPLATSQEEIIERAYKAEVEKMINVGSSVRGSKASIELAHNYPNIWATVGLHPHDAEAIVNFDSAMEEIRELASNDKVVAIGEIGLDYFDQASAGRESVSDEIKKSQLKLFKAQLDIAKDLKKPVILHIRDAWEETYQIINNYKLKITDFNEIGVVHCFTGNAEQAQKFLDLSFYIGFTGFVTFEQAKFKSIREAAKIVPLDKILIETDAPFLAPEPYRGKTNEPSYVVEVAKKIAEIKNLPLEKVAETTTQNAKKVFNISSKK